MIVINSNFLSAMHGFRENEVFCKPEMTSSWFLRQGAHNAFFHDRFWKSDHDLLSNFSSGMHGFRDNEVLLPTGYDVIMISPPGGASSNFHDEFWKSDHDFLIAFHSNFLSGMHGFRYNEVLLPTGYDVIVISPLSGVSHRFCWRKLKERLQFHIHVSLTHFTYLLPFPSYSTFYFGL